MLPILLHTWNQSRLDFPLWPPSAGGVCYYTRLKDRKRKAKSGVAKPCKIVEGADGSRALIIQAVRTLTLLYSNRVSSTEHSICKLKARTSEPLHFSSLYSFILASAISYIFMILSLCDYMIKDWFSRQSQVAGRLNELKILATELKLNFLVVCNKGPPKGK